MLIRFEIKSETYQTVTLHCDRTWSHLHSKYTLECGPMPNVMVALPNIGGALYSTPESLVDAHY